MIVLLVLAWAVVLGPALLRPRFEHSPEVGIRDFERTLGILAGTRHGQQPTPPGRWVMVPKGMEQAPARRRGRVVRRRRQRFVRLLILAAGTLALGLFPGLGTLLWAHLVVDVMVVAYVLYLRGQVKREAQRRRVVREMHAEDEAPTQPQPAIVVYDEAVGGEAIGGEAIGGEAIGGEAIGGEGEPPAAGTIGG